MCMKHVAVWGVVQGSSSYISSAFSMSPLAFWGGVGGVESVMVFFYLMKSQCYDYDGVFLFALLGVFPSLV